MRGIVVTTSRNGNLVEYSMMAMIRLGQVRESDFKQQRLLLIYPQCQLLRLLRDSNLPLLQLCR